MSSAKLAPIIGLALCIFGIVAGQTDATDGPKVPVFKPEYERITEKKGKGNTYYGPDGLCGWWDGEKYVKPLLKYSNPLEGIKVDDGNGSIQECFCYSRFHRIAMQPSCNDPWYKMVKYCAMVEFYNNQLPYTTTKDDEGKDLVLVMVSGCAVCMDGSAEGEIEISLENTWPSGSALTGCSKESNTAGSLKMDLKKTEKFDRQFENRRVMPTDDYNGYKGGPSTCFSFPALLFQRRCEGLFSSDVEETIYKGMKLVVKHGCGGGGTFSVPLGNIDPEQFKYNMVELTGVMLLLEDNTWLQYRRSDYSYWDKAKQAEEGNVGEEGSEGVPAYDNLKNPKNQKLDVCSAGKDDFV